MGATEIGTTVLIRDWNDLYFTGLVVREDKKTITVRGAALGGGWQREENTFPKERIYSR